MTRAQRNRQPHNSTQDCHFLPMQKVHTHRSAQHTHTHTTHWCPLLMGHFTSMALTTDWSTHCERNTQLTAVKCYCNTPFGHCMLRVHAHRHNASPCRGVMYNWAACLKVISHTRTSANGMGWRGVGSTPPVT